MVNEILLSIFISFYLPVHSLSLNSCGACECFCELDIIEDEMSVEALAKKNQTGENKSRVS